MPVWEAQYVLVISERTGWTEDYIRWHLPLWRGRAYYHAARLLAGERCRWPARHEETAAWAQTMRDKIRAALTKKSKSDNEE